jgi:hypothetical protein
MGFFGKILEKLGLKKEEAAPAKPATSTIKPMTAPPAAQPKPVATVQKDKDTVPAAKYDPLSSLPAAKASEPAPTPVSEVDVVKHLEKLSAGSGLDWKVSIVDLLKVLGLDAGKDARIELAKELGCPAELIGGDYSKMNVWLHKEVLKQIAANGGNIPKNLLD